LHTPVIAEIGVGIGATTLAMAQALDNRGELHLFDLRATIVADLAGRGFTSIRGFGNSDRH
jgi:predicted O-methyltransferase YrrM